MNNLEKQILESVNERMTELEVVSKAFIEERKKDTNFIWSSETSRMEDMLNDLYELGLMLAELREAKVIEGMDEEEREEYIKNEFTAIVSSTEKYYKKFLEERSFE